MIPINERILQIIQGNSGIKARRLCATLATEYLSFSGPQIRAAVIEVIHEEELVEIEYTVSGIHESFILPHGASVKGISNVEDLGEVTFD